ncbi:MAG: hypothetical protein J6Y01_06895, partial [Spirochaetales bacterium]|nr:hypothetical protein [Spirochaetales bacterium]
MAAFSRRRCGREQPSFSQGEGFSLPHPPISLQALGLQPKLAVEISKIRQILLRKICLIFSTIFLLDKVLFMFYHQCSY